MTDARCPRCAAHVAKDAPWCGQCYTSLVKEPVKPARQPLHSQKALQVIGAGAPALDGTLPPPPLPPGAIPPPPPPPGTAPGKLKLGKQPWPCVRCETVNKFEDSTCSACGLGFLEALSEPKPSLPLVGTIDGLSKGGKFKIGALVAGGLTLVILITFTIAGLFLG